MGEHHVSEMQNRRDRRRSKADLPHDRTEKLAEVYVAEDADSFVTKGIEEAAERNGIRIIRVPSKRQLGMHCGIETGAAAAGKMLEEQQDTDTKAGKNTGEDPV